MSMDVEDRRGDGEDISAPRARQAYPGRRILWILSISLVLVMGAFLLTYVMNAGRLAAANDPQADASAARTFDGPVVETK
jgi:hypothetical protein